MTVPMGTEHLRAGDDAGHRGARGLLRLRVKPEAVTVIASALAWPATKPTSSSLPAAGVMEPEPALVPVFDCPAEVSSGLAVATPANSWTSTAVFTVVARCTVTVGGGGGVR